VGQLYILRFEAWSAISRFEFDKTWSTAIEAVARTGNWGGVEKGIRHIGAYGTAWGGYVVFESNTPEATAQYQLFYYRNVSHVARVTIEPVVDLDEVLAPAINEARAKERERLRT
jgi:hypothetical protein